MDGRDEGSAREAVVGERCHPNVARQQLRSDRLEAPDEGVGGGRCGFGQEELDGTVVDPRPVDEAEMLVEVPRADLGVLRSRVGSERRESP